MTPLKWALCVPAAIIWLLTAPFAWINDQTGKFLGFGDV